jgi:pSer/pThr/pTyr-binding forkhead associated (FHA) protein
VSEPTREYEFELMAEKSARYGTVAALSLVMGEEAGRLIGLDGPEFVLGREEACNLRFPVDGVSRQHARLWRDAQGQWVISDLKSTNGLFVNGFMTTQQVLRDADRVALGPNLVFVFRHLQQDEGLAREALQVSSSRDQTTGALTLAFFEEMLRFEIELGQRRNFEVAVLCLEFPGLDENRLPGMTQLLEGQLRPGSLLARLGSLRLGLSLVYTSLSEMEKLVQQTLARLKAEFPAQKILYAYSSGRELANTSAALLIERASKLNHVA